MDFVLRMTVEGLRKSCYFYFYRLVSAVKAMTILGLLALLVALGMAIMKLFVLKDNKIVLLAAVGSAFAGGEK